MTGFSLIIVRLTESYALCLSAAISYLLLWFRLAKSLLKHMIDWLWCNPTTFPELI